MSASRSGLLFTRIIIISVGVLSAKARRSLNCIYIYIYTCILYILVIGAYGFKKKSYLSFKILPVRDIFSVSSPKRDQSRQILVSLCANNNSCVFEGEFSQCLQKEMML